jgi:hypothetical protein
MEKPKQQSPQSPAPTPNSQKTQQSPPKPGRKPVTYEDLKREALRENREVEIGILRTIYGR